MQPQPTENEKLRSALQAAVDTIQDYLSYAPDTDPWVEDSRAMGEMDINHYGLDGRLDYALSLLSEASAKPTDQEMIERVAAAIDSADIGFKMSLTRLIDGEHTYELRMDGKVEEFDNTDDVYIRVREIKQRKQAEAVISALMGANVY